MAGIPVALILGTKEMKNKEQLIGKVMSCPPHSKCVKSTGTEFSQAIFSDHDSSFSSSDAVVLIHCLWRQQLHPFQLAKKEGTSVGSTNTRYDFVIGNCWSFTKEKSDTGHAVITENSSLSVLSLPIRKKFKCGSSEYKYWTSLNIRYTIVISNFGLKKNCRL